VRKVTPLNPASILYPFVLFTKPVKMSERKRRDAGVEFNPPPYRKGGDRDDKIIIPHYPNMI